eukprot:6461805-Lingulodinium_polyedra.AAC.1
MLGRSSPLEGARACWALACQPSGGKAAERWWRRKRRLKQPSAAPSAPAATGHRQARATRAARRPQNAAG